MGAGGVIGGYCEDGFPFFYANQRMAEMLGYGSVGALEAGIGGLVANTIHPDDMPNVSEDLGELVEGRVYESTYRMLRADGTYFWTVDRGRVIRASDGRLAIISMCNDMSTMVRRERELEHKHQVSSAMLDNLPGGYHRCSDEEGFPFLYMSQRFCDILGWSKAEIERRFSNSFAALVHPEDLPGMVDYVAKIDKAAAEDGGWSDSFYRMLGRDGWHWVIDSTQRVEIDGHAVYQGFIGDVTSLVSERDERERKLDAAMEQVRRANASKTDFLRHMSHDIRTPLNGIIGMLEIAERHPYDYERLKDCRAKELSASRYLLSLVNDILDVSRLETGGVILDNRPFDLGEILEESNAVAELRAADVGVSFIVEGDHPRLEHRRLIGSPTHLNRVLMNLATNAIKYNRDGGWVRVCATEVACDGQTATYRFVCKDNGRGMSEEFQKHAFEPFAREGRGDIATFSGTGLGLSIVKQMVELMGGTVELASKIDEGSTFTLTIPFKLDLSPVGHEWVVHDVDLDGRRALLVEDNALNLEIAQLMLEDMGLEVETAANGLEALERFEGSELGYYDLIFMDVMMPVMDGLTATSAIRALERPDATSVIILAMTANAFLSDVHKSLKAGMNAHVSKPVDEKRVREAIAQAMMQA